MHNIHASTAVQKINKHLRGRKVTPEGGAGTHLTQKQDQSNATNETILYGCLTLFTAAAIMSGAKSIPTTWHPLALISAVSTPSPQPTSRIRSPLLSCRGCACRVQGRCREGREARGRRRKRQKTRTTVGMQGVTSCTNPQQCSRDFALLGILPSTT